MSEISKQTMQSVLKHYKPGTRFLLSADLEYPIMRGEFLIGKTYYYLPSFKHATDIEIQLCLNQLAYVAISEAMKQNLIPELKELNFENLMKENMLIIESRKRFRRPIPTDREIQGQIKLKEWRDDEILLRGWADFQFENRSCFGNLELALVKP